MTEHFQVGRHCLREVRMRLKEALPSVHHGIRCSCSAAFPYALCMQFLIATKTHLRLSPRNQMDLGRPCGIKVQAFRKAHIPKHVRGGKALGVEVYGRGHKYVPEGGDKTHTQAVFVFVSLYCAQNGLRGHIFI